MKNGLVRIRPKAHPNQERRQTNFQRRGGQRKKQDRKIAPCSPYRLYQYHLENPRGLTLPTPMILTPLSPTRPLQSFYEVNYRPIAVLKPIKS